MITISGDREEAVVRRVIMARCPSIARRPVPRPSDTELWFQDAFVKTSQFIKWFNKSADRR